MKKLSVLIPLVVIAALLSGCATNEPVERTETEIAQEAKTWCEENGNYFFAWYTPMTDTNSPVLQYVCMDDEEELEEYKQAIFESLREEVSK